MWAQKALASLGVLVLALLTVFAVPPSAQALNLKTAYTEIPEEIRTNVIEPLWGSMKAAGLSEAAAAGVIGNLLTESGGNALADNGSGCHGLLQWCPTGGSTVNDVKANSSTLAAARAYQLPLVTSIAAGGGWVNTYVKEYNIQAWKPGMKQYTKEEWMTIADPGDAAVVFALFERPCTGKSSQNGPANKCKAESDKRQLNANIVYTALTGKTFEGGTPAGEGPTTEGEKTTNPLGVTEDELVGLPGSRDYTKDQNVPDLPSGSSLSAEQMQTLVSTQGAIAEQSTDGVATFLRTAVAFLGMLAILLGILILVAYAFDTMNAFFDFSLLSAITLGKRHLKTDEEDTSPGAVGLSGVLTMTIVALGVGFVLVSGAVFTGALAIDTWFQSSN